MEADLAQRIQATAWKLYPDTFAYMASGGQWKPYKWLEHVSSIIGPAIIAGNARILVEAPPQHGKSQLISNWVPTWYMNLFPTKRVLLTSYSSDYAIKWGATVKENLTINPLASIPMKRDTASKKNFATVAGGEMICSGIGGPITGRSADLLIIDDPFKDYAEAMSARIRERNMDWYRSVARTRVQPGGSIVILHTRWHESDMIGELKLEGGWTVIRLPAMAEENDPLGRVPGGALCPERFDNSALTDIKKDLGGMIWDALYQQNPTAKGGNIVHGDWIQRYDESPDMDEVAIFADLTYKEGEENDFTCIEAWGRKGASIYLLAQIRGQMGFGEQLKSFVRMCELYPKAYHKEIEEKANGAAVIETVKTKIPGIFANNPHTSKEARLHVVAPIYEALNVYYPNEHKHPWVKVNIQEITRFPKWKNDDTVDCASMAVAYFGRMASTLQRLAALTKR